MDMSSELHIVEQHKTTPVLLRYSHKITTPPLFIYNFAKYNEALYLNICLACSTFNNKNTNLMSGWKCF